MIFQKLKIPNNPLIISSNNYNSNYNMLLLIQLK